MIDLKLSRLKEQNNQLRKEVKESLRVSRHYQKQLFLALGLQEYGLPVRRKLSIKAKGTGESTAVTVASDWHWDEEIKPQTIEGLNHFTEEIAAKRAIKYFENTLILTEMSRARTKIKTLVWCMLGDFFTGRHFEELVEITTGTPPQIMLDLLTTFVSGLEFWVKEGGFDEILIVTATGNHSRITKRTHVATRNYNSFEWLLYHFFRRYWDALHPKSIVKFKISDGYFNRLQIYKTRLRMHHGDGIKYQGGIGGIHIPLNKAIAQWDKAIQADVDILGHWHSFKSDRKYMVNGSLIGYSPYSEWIKADYEPPTQGFFLVHPKMGKTVSAPIHLE